MRVIDGPILKSSHLLGTDSLSLFEIGALLDQLPVVYVSEAELLRAGFSPDVFDNLNTPADLERAAARLR